MSQFQKSRAPEIPSAIPELPSAIPEILNSRVPSIPNSKVPTTHPIIHNPEPITESKFCLMVLSLLSDEFTLKWLEGKYSIMPRLLSEVEGQPLALTSVTHSSVLRKLSPRALPTERRGCRAVQAEILWYTHTKLYDGFYHE